MDLTFIKTLTALSLCILVLSTDAAEICRRPAVDFIFLIDGSRSVRPSNFVLVKNYMKEFTTIFDKLGPPGSQIAVIQFASRVREEIALNRYNSTTELRKAIDKIEYMEMGTMTGEALKYLLNVALLPSHGSRLNQGVRTAAIIITDGKSQDYFRGTVTQYQREAKNRGVEISAIGVGQKVNHAELLELASIPKSEHVYEVKSFDAIEKLELRLSGSQTCEPIVPDNIQITHITHTTSEVSWDIGEASDDDISYYLLVYVRTSGVGDEVEKRIYGNRTTTLIDLEPHTRYKVSIRAVIGSDVSPPVKETFTTLSLGSTRLTLSNATLTTLIATWLPAEGDGLAGYELSYAPAQPPFINGEEPIPAIKTIRMEPFVLERKLTGLDPDTIYAARIIPLYGDLPGTPASDEAKTEELRPPFVKVMNTTLSTLAAIWSINADYPIDTWSIAVFETRDGTNLQTMEKDGSITETIFHGLEPYTQYMVEVKANVEEAGRQFTSSKGTAVKRTKLLKKPKVSASNVTYTSLIAHWTELNFMADSWTVRVYPPSDPTLSQEKETGRGQRSATFQNLLPSTMYRIEVTGHVEEDGATFQSQKGKHKAKTGALIGPPVEVINATLTKLTGVWQDINVPVDKWIVTLFIDGSDAALQEYRMDGQQHSLVFKDLALDTTYRVEVRGQVNQGSISLDSPIGEAQGSTGSGLDYDAPFVSCDSIGSPSSLNVEWPETDYKVNSWVVVIGPGDNPEALTTYKESSQQYSKEISDLQPNTEYLVEVYGEVTEGISTTNLQSGYATCATDPLIAPPVEVTATTYLSIAIRWEDINMPMDTWTINLLNADKEVLQTTDVQGDVHEINFNGLQQGTDYDFQVIGHVTRENTTHDSPIGATSGTTKSFINVAGPVVECLESSLTSIGVLWSDVSIPVNSWTIHYFPEGEEQIRKDINDISPEDQKERIITELKPATRYTVEIIGNVHEGRTVFRTQPGVIVCPTKPITAPVVEVTNTTYHSLTARWNEINVKVNTWFVTIVNEENGLQRSQVLEHGTNKLIFTGLDQDTLYDIRVVGQLRAENLNSPPGTTNGTTGELSSPFFECYKQTVLSLSVSWAGVATSLDSWTVLIFTDNQDEGRTVLFDGATSEATIDSLIPETKYTLKLEGRVAQDGKDYTTPVEYIDCVTESLTRPGVDVINITPSSLEAKWRNNNDLPMDTWTVIVKRRYQKQIYNITVSGDVNQYNFEDLLPRTWYTIDVAGHLRGKKTPFGRTSSVTLPLTPPLVEINNPTLSTLTVEWSDINMDMTSWIVTIKEEGSIEDIASKTVNGSARDVLFDGLQPDTSYQVSVTGKLVAQNTTRYSPVGEALGTTESIDAPHVTCYNTTANSVAVSWTNVEVTPISYWIVRIAETGSGSYEEVKKAADQFQHVFKLLRPSTTYVVEVVGNIVEDETTFSSSSMRDSCTTKPLPPRNIVTTERGITHLIASFDPPNSLADDYEAKCTPTDDFTNPTRGEVNAEEYTVDCQDLDPATEYVISLKTIYKGLLSTSIHTINTTLTPSPSGLTLSEPTTHTILATWQAPDGDVDRYYVSYNSSYDDVELRLVPGDTTSLRLTDLEPNTLYHVRVEAEMNEKRSCPDEAAESTLSEIIQLQIDDVGYTTINVSWNASSVPHVESYCLEYALASGESEETELNLPSDVLKYTISDLRTATEYELSIKAKYLKTKSEETEKFATTLALPPIGPMTFSDVTESSFIAHWLPPDGTPQPKSYTVTYFTEEVDPITVENVPNPSLLIEGLTPETLYDVTVSASYDDDLVSHPIRGQETTLDLSACSCSTYLKSQRQMQSMLVQMMEHINDLNEKIDRLTSSRRTRSSRRYRKSDRGAENK